jgi:phosphoglycolate phosphatase-like HAD superfamily hydrolase
LPTSEAQPVIRANLWLFDIDGTLVDTGGAGLCALQQACRDMFGRDAPELDLAGSTDSGIVQCLLEHFRLPHRPADEHAFYQAYLARLEWNLNHGGFKGRVLPGAIDLLDRLARADAVTTGLLTGNIAGGAAAKLRHFGLAGHFPFGAFGDDHHDRNALGPLALRRAAAHAGRHFSAAEAVVVGDTPKDVACARAAGLRCLAVATGKFPVEALRACGADLVVAGLDELVSWW